MIYLGLAILSSALISVLMRLSEKHSKSSLAMLAMNYLMCGGMAAVFTGEGGLMPIRAEGFSMALLLGVLGGVGSLGAFRLMQWNIARNGVVLPSTFMKLGILVPTIFSVAIFGEEAGLLKWLGVILAIAAILLMHGGGSVGDKSLTGLVLLMLAGGCADFMSKLFEELAPATLQNQFLFYIFVVALMLCVALCLVKKQRPGMGDLLFGLAIGIPNYFSSRFLLLSLETVPAMAAFPSFSVGTILLVAAAGVLLFKERLSGRKYLALLIILGALVLLNWS